MEHLSSDSLWGGGEALQGAAPIGFIGSVAGTEAFEAYLQSADDHLQVPVPIKAGDHLIGVSFVDRWRVEEGVPAADERFLPRAG